MSESPHVSVVIPVYNEEQNLPLLADEIDRAMAASGNSCEVVWIDDGSTDSSLEVLRRLSDRPHHRLLCLGHNLGQSAALAAGFHAARAPVVVTLDADLQNDPADIPRLLAELADCDLVSGVRAERHDSWLRRFSSKVANRVRDRVIHDGVSDVGCSLKAYRREYLSHLQAWNGMHRFLPALARMQGARIKEIPVRHRPRVHGESKYNVRNRLLRGLVDLAGVWWLRRRWLDPRPVEEIGSGSGSDTGNDTDEPGPRP